MIDLERILACLLIPSSSGLMAAVETESDDFVSNDVFPVAELAHAAHLAASLALRRLIYGGNDVSVPISIDKKLAYSWFKQSVEPVGWSLAPIWDDLAGDYRAKDGWVRLHTNAEHHRNAAIHALKAASQDEMERVITGMNAKDVEQRVVAAHGAAAAMMSFDQWRAHLQGFAVRKAPLLAHKLDDQPLPMPLCASDIDPLRPLAGIKVLDLTRIIAGPVATRFLAAYGADVLRIDPPDWAEGDYIVDMNVGKRCATLDLKTKEGLEQLWALISEVDILIHGYRADALERLGIGAAARKPLNPSLIDVALNAYGWSGPWKNRRGFDSLVQMSTGIADYGMRIGNLSKPRPLSVQALDHATGLLMAACAIRGLDIRRQQARASQWRLSLAGTAQLLTAHPLDQFSNMSSDLTAGDYQDDIEQTELGPVQRLNWPVQMGSKGGPFQPILGYWDRPATKLHQARPTFKTT